MNEFILDVTDAPDGGFTARALSVSIHTEADTLAGLRVALRVAGCCHFDEGLAPPTIRLRYFREEVFAA